MKDSEQTFRLDTSTKQSELEIDIRTFFERLFQKWKLIIICLLLFVSAGVLYLRYANDTYELTAMIFINDSDSGGMSNELSNFSDLEGLNQSSVSVFNEIGILKSRSLMESVVKRLNINVSYYSDGKINNSLINPDDVPFKLTFSFQDSVFYNMSKRFEIKILSGDKFQFLEEDSNLSRTVQFGNAIKYSQGEITVTPISSGQQLVPGESYFVRIEPIENVVDVIHKKLVIEPLDKNSSLVQLYLQDQLWNRGRIILNELIQVYNEEAIAYKNLITENTDKFVSKRLEDISQELSSVDQGVQDYKVENRLSDMDYESSLILETNTELNRQLVDLNSQIRVVDYVINYLENNDNNLIPANIGLEDESIASNVTVYNDLLLERNRIRDVSSERNPAVVNLNGQLNALRANIMQSLVNLRSSIEFLILDLREQEGKLNYRKSNAPKQEKELEVIKRKQQIIESLYLYLLQKREENAISIGVPVPNAKIVDSAYGSTVPISPNPLLVIISSVFMGLFAPVILTGFQLVVNNKIQTSDELKNLLPAPFLGDIPLWKNKGFEIVVDETKKTSIAEAFRILRTNIDYMLSTKNRVKKIFVTSTLAGEGKTFITLNLASTLASNGKRVLVVEADMRKPKIKRYLQLENKMGLSNYLASNSLRFDNIISSSSKISFDVISAGDLPPNPTTLLSSERFSELLVQLEESYDFILIDTAPVGLVTDTLIISKEADLFLYVVRSNMVDRRLLKIPQELYKNQRLTNMTTILNASNFRNNGYGYSYGYGS
jgi:capsular exopolysaccharide synthesis family protein